MDGAQSLGGHALLEKLGEGGMGAVWLALDPRTGARRALKVLTVVDAELRLRFAREGEAMARVDGHPNVVRVHAAGEDRGRAYIVMDLVAGGTLAARLREGPLAAAEVAALGRDLARALAHVHARGVLHRDIKPGNVLFDEAGAPKLADFGLARASDHASLTATGTVLGTPAYMAPEQADGRPVDARADVYALGAVLYHAATGRPPYAGGSTLAVLARVLSDDPAPPRTLAPGLPVALEAVILRAMARDPAARFPTAEALAQALAGALAAPPTERPRRGLAATALAGAGVVLLVVAASRPGPPDLPAAGPPAPAEIAATTTAWTADALAALVLREDAAALAAALDGPLERGLDGLAAAALVLLEGPEAPARRPEDPWVAAVVGLSRGARLSSSPAAVVQALGPLADSWLDVAAWAARAEAHEDGLAALRRLLAEVERERAPPPLGAAARVAAQRRLLAELDTILHVGSVRVSGASTPWQLPEVIERARALAPDGPSGAALRVLNAALFPLGEESLSRRLQAFAAVDDPALDERLARSTRPQFFRGLRAATWLATAPPLEAARRHDEGTALLPLAAALEAAATPGTLAAAERLTARAAAGRVDAAAYRAWLLRGSPAAGAALAEAFALARALADAPRRALLEGRLCAFAGDQAGLRAALDRALGNHQFHLLDAELHLLAGEHAAAVELLAVPLRDRSNPAVRDPDFWCVVAAARALGGNLPEARDDLGRAQQLGRTTAFLPWRTPAETARLLDRLEGGWAPEGRTYLPD